LISEKLIKIYRHISAVLTSAWSPLKSYKKAFIALVFFTSLAIFSARTIILTPGTIIHHDWSIPPFSEQIAFGQVPRQYEFIPSIFPGVMNQVLALYLHVNGEALSKAILIFVPSFSGFLAYCLLRSLGLCEISAFLGGLFYSINPFVFTRLVADGVEFPYVLHPLIIMLYSKTMRNSKNLVPVLLMTPLLFILSAPFIVLIFISIALYTLSYMICNPSLRTFVSATKNLAFVLFLIVLLNIWWLPASNVGSEVVLQSLEADLELRSRFLQVQNVIRLTGFTIPWFENALSDYYPFWQITSWILFLTVVIFSPILNISTVRSKCECIPYAIICIVVGTWLGKGINPPFGEIYKWVIMHVPSLILFRDPYKWLFLSAIGFAILIAFATDKLIGFGHGFRRKIFATFLLAFLILSNGAAFFSGDYGGFLRPINFPPAYKEVVLWLMRQEGMFRVLWLPPDSYISYDWISSSSPQMRDLFAYYSPKPNILDSMQPLPITPWERFSTYLALLFYQPNQTRHIDKLLALLGVRYVIVRWDAESSWWLSRNPSFNRGVLKRTLEMQENLQPIFKTGNITVYEVQNWSLIEAYQSVMIVSGGFNLLTSISNFNTSIKPLIFADGLSYEDLAKISSCVDAILLDREEGIQDLIFACIPRSFKIEVALYARDYPFTIGWSRLFTYYWTYDFSYLDSTVDAAITRSSKELIIPFKAPNDGEYELWVKAFSGEECSRLYVSVDETMINTVITKSTKRIYQWFFVGNVTVSSGLHNIRLRADASGTNIVSLIVFAPKEELKKAYELAWKLFSSSNLMLFLECEDINLTNNIGQICFNYDFKRQGLSGVSRIWATEGTKYSYQMNNSKLSIMFTQPANVDENVNIFFALTDPIDLTKNPLIQLDYKLQDPNAQTAYIMFGLDLTGDKVEDVKWVGYERFERYPSTTMHSFTLNALQLAYRYFPNSSSYLLTSVQIAFGKMPGFDASRNPTEYIFELKDLKVYAPAWIVFKDFTASRGEALISTGFGEASCTIKLPLEANCTLLIRGKGLLEIKINDIMFKVGGPQNNTWIASPSFNAEGPINMTFSGDKGSILDAILIYTNDLKLNGVHTQVEVSTLEGGFGVKASIGTVIIAKFPFSSQWSTAEASEAVLFPVFSSILGIRLDTEYVEVKNQTYLIKRMGLIIVNTTILIAIILAGILYKRRKGDGN